VLRSRDGGVTWLPATRDLPTTSAVKAVALDPKNPSRLYAAVEGAGIYRSVNGGATWTRSNNGGPSTATDVVIDRRRTRVLYSAGWDRSGAFGGVYRSLDGGATWADISAGVTTNVTSALALTPNGRRLYAGTGSGDDDGGGVFAAKVR